MQEFAKAHGYAMVRRSAKPTHDEIKTKFIYVCDRWRSPGTTEATVRNTAGRGTGCSFQIKIHRTSTMNEPEIWDLTIMNGTHNHDASHSAASHGVHRRRSRAPYVNEIRSMITSGVTPRALLSTFTPTDPDLLIRRSDVCNERDHERNAYLQGRTPIQALIDELSQSEDWIVKYRTGPDRKVELLFFAHIKQAELMRCYPDLFAIDCTYKTNRYRMPLLHFLGVLLIGKYFSAAFCFMGGETEEYYLWAINAFKDILMAGLPHSFKVAITDNEAALKNAIKAVYPDVPQLLCIWHINKNVLVHAQQA
jgi:hypothetical protein